MGRDEIYEEARDELKAILDTFTDDYVGRINVESARLTASYNTFNYGMERERWKAVQYQNVVVGRYWISSWGRMIDTEYGLYFVSTHIDDTDYVRVGLACIDEDKKSKVVRVHRIVTTAFVPFVTGKTHVNHKDLNRRNNYYKNLEWTTNRENLRHGYINGSHDNRGGHTYFTPEEINTIREKHKNGVSIKELGEEYNRDRRGMANIVNYKSYGDVFWKQMGITEDDA